MDGSYLHVLFNISTPSPRQLTEPADEKLCNRDVLGFSWLLQSQWVIQGKRTGFMQHWPTSEEAKFLNVSFKGNEETRLMCLSQSGKKGQQKIAIGASNQHSQQLRREKEREYLSCLQRNRGDLGPMEKEWILGREVPAWRQINWFSLNYFMVSKINLTLIWQPHQYRKKIFVQVLFMVRGESRVMFINSALGEDDSANERICLH